MFAFAIKTALKHLCEIFRCTAQKAAVNGRISPIKTKSRKHRQKHAVSYKLFVTIISQNQENVNKF